MDAYLTRAQREIDAAVGSLPPERLTRAVPGRWSVAEILEHLTLAFSGTRSGLEKALVSGELKARPPRLQQQLARVMVVDLGYFPRVEAPETTKPKGSIAAELGVVAIREALTAMDDTLTRAAGRFGPDALVANHPYFAGLTVRQWRKFHWRHTCHHMKQVRARVMPAAV